MSWIVSNWIWIILIGGMIAMHLRHGGHGGTPRRSDQSNAPEGAHAGHTTQRQAVGDEDASASARHGGC